ncbi:MAG: glycosyltransferase family 61 protein, partial [Desulfobacterota bacterium]|nr:glycosyltransferase family 61 protein [Thermodesulfobacteriota bacterium]
QGKRVYISRDRVKRRQIVNELDVCRDLQTRGFEIVHPEEMTFTEQVHYFRSAKTIVAPHGGGLTNMVWAERPRVIELMPQPYNNPCYWLASSAIAEQYGMIVLDGFCDHSAMAKNLRVDIDKINHVLEQMET